MYGIVQVRSIVAWIWGSVCITALAILGWSWVARTAVMLEDVGYWLSIVVRGATGQAVALGGV